MNQGVTRKCNPSFFAVAAAANMRCDATTRKDSCGRPPAVDALVFDAYDALFDVHSVTAMAERLFPGHGARLSQLWRTKQIEYTWLTSLMAQDGGAARAPRPDFAAVTAMSLDYALDYALASLRLDPASSGRSQLQDAYLSLTPFPDVADALAALAPRPRWILSNGTLTMLQPPVRNAGLARHIDDHDAGRPAGAPRLTPVRARACTARRSPRSPARSRSR